MTDTARRTVRPDPRWAGLDKAITRRTLRVGVPADPGRIDQARQLFGTLPGDYVTYVTRYGHLAGTAKGGDEPVQRTLLGLTADPQTDAGQSASILRALHRLPERWIPIELLPDRQVACVDADSRSGEVRLFDLDEMRAGGVPYAPGLVDFLYDWLADLYAVSATLQHLNRQQVDVAAGRRATDQLDRPGEWTVTRLCSQDVVFAVLRGRHNRDHNRYDVSVFATATLTSFASGATVRAALTAVLSDAYRSGGPLAVSFGSDGNGILPGPLRRWAAEHQITLPRRGGWDAATGERLYQLAADLTAGSRELLPVQGVSIGAVCHAVASGDWSREAVEAILRWSPAPQRILTGAVAVTDRLGWIVDLQTVRAAFVLAAAARVLRRSGSLSDDDDSGIDLTVTFDTTPLPGCDASAGAVRLAVDGGKPGRLPWRTLAGAAGPGMRLHVLAVENHLLTDQLWQLTGGLRGTGATVVVPADANTSTDPALADALDEAGRAGLHVVAAPDYTSTLDAAADRAMDRARTARS